MSDPESPYVDDTPAGVTPGSQPLAPEPATEPQAAFVLTCPICGHAESGHASGRCLIMLGTYGTEGPCPCPEPLPA